VNFWGSDLPLAGRERVEARLGAPVTPHLLDDLRRAPVLPITNGRLRQPDPGTALVTHLFDDF
jgi:hypothetical protein